MTTSLHHYWHPLEAKFKANGISTVAAGAKAYMKNQSEFFGLKAPERRTLQQEFLKETGLPDPHQLSGIIINAWEQPQREFQYSAMEVLFKMRKQSTPQLITLYEFMITHKSWWDTVDYLAPNLAGDWFTRYPEQRDEIIAKWMKSENIWLQRACLLFQLKYKDRTDAPLLFSLITKLKTHKEFFIRKAIGWSLREYAKVNPDAVRSFVENTTLSGLSQREAMKHIGRKHVDNTTF
ncbi:MAG: DNA alkylation repair protein [Bacteroidales bacterium]|nr:DNA alkylation repair protein [Bacteroidales bacterium]